MELVLQPKQAEVFQSKATELFFGGAAGGGKSHALRCAAIYYSVAIVGLQTYLFRRSYPDLTLNHMAGATGFPSLLAEWTQSGFCKINYSDLEIRFKNGPTGGFDGGSRINLRHCQYEKDVLQYKGAEFNLLLIDELTTFTDVIYRFLRGRVRLAGLKIPKAYEGLFPRIICSSNPGDVGHQFVKATFIDSALPNQIWRAPADEGGMLRQFIPALLKDNQKLTEDDPTYADRLRGLGDPALVKAMLEGDWNSVQGAAVADVWAPHRQILEPFKIPPGWRIDRAYDWGESRPSCCLWFAESDGSPCVTTDGKVITYAKGTIFVIRQYYSMVVGKPNQGTRATIAEQAQIIHAVDLEYGYVFAGPADSMIYNSQNATRSFYDEFVSYGVDWVPADKSKGTRVDGLSRIRAMLKISMTGVMTEQPGLYIFNNCYDLIRTLPTLPRDKNNPDDVDSDAEDHAFDTLRYRLLAKPQNASYVRLVGF